MIKTVIFDIGNVLTRFCWNEYFADFHWDEQLLRLSVTERCG